MALDIIESKIFTALISKTTRKAPINICKYSVLNKGAALINVPRIFHDPSGKTYLPTGIKFDDPNDPRQIRPKKINFNKFIHYLVLQDNSILPSRCQESDFTVNHYQHIATGDWQIIKNNKLRKLFTKGPKYREDNKISREGTKAGIMNGYSDCIDAWCNKHGIDKSILTE